MESLPTEILDHVFDQFPNKCEICQKKCLRASPRQELSKCSNTSERWNRIIEQKIKEIDTLTKCYRDFENVTSLTINIQPEDKGEFGMYLFGSFNSNAALVGSISKDGPVDRDGRIRINDSILQVNGITFDEGMAWHDILNVLKNAVILQYVQLVVGQKTRDPNRKYPCGSPI